MAVDVFKALGLKQEWATIEDEEKLHEAFQKEYIHRDLITQDATIVNAITGKRMGTIDTKLNGFIPAEGFDTEAIKDKKVEEKAEAIINHWKTQAETAKSALEEVKKGGGADDKKVAELTEKYKQLESKYAIVEKQAKDFEALATTTKNDYEGKIKGITVGSSLKGLMAKIPFADGLPELAKKGFENEVNSTYKFDVNEKGELEVFDTEGKPLQKEKGAGIMNAEEAITALATKHKIIKMHNAAPPKKVPAEADKKDYNRTLPNSSIRAKMGQ